MNNTTQTEEELLKQTDINSIVQKGQEIYEKIKAQYEPKQNGKFLAIEGESEKVFLGNTSTEVLEIAKREFPNKVFYVVKIGFASTEIMARTVSPTPE